MVCALLRCDTRHTRARHAGTRHAAIERLGAVGVAGADQA